MSQQKVPFISICIPAYKRTHYLQRLLNSIAVQTFRDFEVIITDDSGNDDSVALLCRQFEAKFSLHYYKNETALGTPANWNCSIGKATGEWIKLMHDDDWFASPISLQTFAEATNTGYKFIICGYNNIDDNSKVLSKAGFTLLQKKFILHNPMVLLSENYIGQPSVTMVHCSITAMYDERMKWRVDIDYYMQLLSSEKKFTRVTKVLINLGISSSQVTNSCLNVPAVELPEGLLLLEKYGKQSLQNILVYDAWWRIIRNTNTRSRADLYRFASPWPKAIEKMVEQQAKINPLYLRKGVFSKLFMIANFLKNSF